ncbi:glycoside hydrolase family 73 protein, partial [Brenneria corticis]
GTTAPGPDHKSNINAAMEAQFSPQQNANKATSMGATLQKTPSSTSASQAKSAISPTDKKHSSPAQNASPTKKEFVKKVYAAALEEEKKTGVPAAVTTAQAILETGYGKSVPTDINTGKYSYNLFGIKAHGSPNYVENWTHENINGKRVKIIDKFAAYDSYEESIAGRSEFLRKNKRYQSLFESKDPKVWAQGLQDKGYATDPDYAKKLISIMNSQELL